MFAIFALTSLMVIDDLDVFRRAIALDEADSPLVVDPNTKLTLPAAGKSLKPVSWDYRHVLKFPCIVQHSKFPARYRSDIAESAALVAMKKLLSLPAAEGSYHMESISRWSLNGRP